MIYIDKKKISFISTHFRYKKENLLKMLYGKKGEKYQIFSLILLSLDEEFIEKIVNDIPMEKIKGVDYLTIESIVRYFPFQKNQPYTWKSKEKKRFIKTAFTCT